LTRADDGDFKKQLKDDIKAHIITQKANACPMAMRIAWHSAGTFNKSDNSGGTNISVAGLVFLFLIF